MLASLIHIIAQTHVILPTPHVDANNNLITTITDILYTIVGAISFLFIVYGGFKYVVSHGDPQATAKAKDTIIYAAIGLLIVLSATIITNFVITGIKP